MKTYRVTASYRTFCTVEIEAEDQDHAYDIAKELDGSVFESTIDPDDWHIEHIEEKAT
jgi:hypothetical protein